MDTPSLISKAAPATSQVARNVTESQLSGPTPCSAFDVKALANHVAGFYGMSALAARKQQLSGEPGADIVGNDPAAVIPGLIDGVVAAWQEPGATEGKARFGTHEFDAGFAASITLWETVVHGWDLAVSTGQEFHVDDETGQAIFGVARQICTDEQRGEGKPWGAEVAVPADASPFEKALGLSGRDPGWSA